MLMLSCDTCGKRSRSRRVRNFVNIALERDDINIRDLGDLFRGIVNTNEGIG